MLRTIGRVIGMSALCGLVAAQAADGPDPQVLPQVTAKAVGYLEKIQNADGSFGAQKMPAITAICVTGLLRSGRTPDDPIVAKALKHLEGFARDDGGIYPEKSRLPNYETSLCLVCFVEANKDGRYDKLIKKTEGYVRQIQWDGGENVDESDFKFGGIGYGTKGKPDLSNTTVLVDALKSLGSGPDDKNLKEALVFVSRCQNLESEHNTTPNAAKVNDGGFYYSLDGGPSYGSMTYAAVKSLVYAGLTKDDKRVEAALKWMRKNYDLKQHPGQGTAGLYYYYHSFAKTLAALGEPTFTDAQGVAHDWKQELVAELASRQKSDGSWVNTNKTWLEDDAALVTGYCLLSLSYCKSAK